VHLILKKIARPSFLSVAPLKLPHRRSIDHSHPKTPYFSRKSTFDRFLKFDQRGGARRFKPITPLPKRKALPYILRLMKLGSLLYPLSFSAALLLQTAAQSTGPDDLYLQAYSLIQEGDQYTQSGQRELARQRYEEAQANLKKIQHSYPSYSKNAVEYRLDYIGEKLKTLPAPADPSKAAPALKPAAPLTGREDSRVLLDRITQLQADNTLLQAKLQEALSPKPASVDPNEFARSQERITQLEKEKELLRVRLDQAQAKQPQAADMAMLDQVRGELEGTKKQLRDNVATVAALSQENQRLKQSLTEASTAKPRDGAPAAELETLTNQLATLKARLDVYEARKIPFTPEELALMDKNVPKLATAADVKPAKRAPRELPPGAGLIVADAERAFAARRYTEAEEKYKQVLKMDEENSVSLANLAAIQLELQKLDEAEQNLKKAIANSPQDPYALSLMGMLRFQQGKYNEALDALSRSAQLDPKNAETQNYLGITLSQQGQREAAETALRKAITLNPNYAGAHHNIAVIYATQKPPYMELAKYHYHKALTLGQPPNPELEKQLGK
jgi:tetratricopeptide (TPR) repeat protein